jgi:hypothetical protein
MSNFREVFIEVQAVVNAQGEDREELMEACATTEESHPRLWRLLEHAVAHRYERATHHKIPARDFDWQTIKQWIIDNWPQIVRVLITIIIMFI